MKYSADDIEVSFCTLYTTSSWYKSDDTLFPTIPVRPSKILTFAGFLWISAFWLPKHGLFF